MFLCVFAKCYSLPLHYLFSPKSFPCLNDFGIFHSVGFPPESGDSGSPFMLKTRIQNSDLPISFQACGQNLSAGEFHWQRLGSEPAFSGWGPKWHSLLVFSLQSLSSPTRGKTWGLLLDRLVPGCQQRQGPVADYLRSVIASADSHFPLVSALRCAQCGCIQSPVQHLWRKAFTLCKQAAEEEE